MPITAVIEAAEKLAVAEKHMPAARPAPEQPAFGSVEAEMTGARASEMPSNNLPDYPHLSSKIDQGVAI